MPVIFGPFSSTAFRFGVAVPLGDVIANAGWVAIPLRYVSSRFSQIHRETLRETEAAPEDAYKVMVGEATGPRR